MNVEVNGFKSEASSNAQTAAINAAQTTVESHKRPQAGYTPIAGSILDGAPELGMRKDSALKS